jgi:N-methylhydantoinase B
MQNTVMIEDRGPADWIVASGCDPITFSLILNRLNAIADEMTSTLERSAWTSILSVSRDFSCAIYDAVPRQVAMFDALPVHTTSLHLVLAEIARTFAGDVHDGDVFICNDPYRFNTHVGDVVTAAPVFVDGEHRFWSVTKGHQMDIGAFVPSSVTAAAQNVWQEGLTIPPVKLVDRGRRRDDIVELYLANVRYRELLLGDLMAQLGSIEKGRQRLIELCGEHTAAEVMRYVDTIITYASRRMADQIRRMPDGVYRAEGWIDSDGVDVLDIPIKVTVSIQGDHVTVDYEGSGPQAKGGVNGSYATSQAAGAVPFLYYIDPEIPHNHGVIDHITVKAPLGSICNPRYPASTSCATVVPTNMMCDVINKALGQAMPERVLAGIPRAANVPQFAGETDWSGNAWGAMLFNNRGGMGAAFDVDGWPLFGSHGSFGGLKTQSVEQIELLYPLLVEVLEIEPDSMGFGRHNGGAGIRMVVLPRNGAVEVITFGDGSRNPPHGIAGGTRAIGGGQYVEDPDTGLRRFASASGQLRVSQGGRYVGVSSGGGGHGNPLDRDLERVRRDVRDGFVSRAAATVHFGVVLDDSPDPQILAEETRQRRELLAKKHRPEIDPVTPAAGTWAQDNMRSGDVFLLNPG